MVKKIKSQKAIIEIFKGLKKRNKKIVTISGSFDILHLGHIKSFQQAKAQGDILIVLLNSDRSVRSYKGSKRPINSEKNRAQVLAAIEDIDYITLFDEIIPNKILEKIKPDIFCQGQDWGEGCIERKIVENYGGEIYILKWQSGLSTSELINKVVQVYSQPVTKAVFLDRDGTINVNEPEYCHKIEDFKFIPCTFQALKKLSKTNFKLIIVTNQSGIGRGYYQLNDMQKLHQWMLNQFKRRGIRIDKIYYCPHHPQAGCNCRKPKPGMLLKAVKDFNISLNDSWLISDDQRDVIMGRQVNAKTIKLGSRMDPKLKLEPNYYIKNLMSAVNIILNQEKQ